MLSRSLFMLLGDVVAILFAHLVSLLSIRKQEKERKDEEEDLYIW